METKHGETLTFTIAPVLNAKINLIIQIIHSLCATNHIFSFKQPSVSHHRRTFNKFSTIFILFYIAYVLRLFK